MNFRLNYISEESLRRLEEKKQKIIQGIKEGFLEPVDGRDDFVSPGALKESLVTVKNSILESINKTLSNNLIIIDNENLDKIREEIGIGLSYKIKDENGNIKEMKVGGLEVIGEGYMSYRAPLAIELFDLYRKEFSPEDSGGELEDGEYEIEVNGKKYNVLEIKKVNEIH